MPGAEAAAEHGRRECRPVSSMGFLLRLDESAVRLVRELHHPVWLTRGMVALSRATEHSDGWLLAGLGGAMLDHRRRAPWLRGTATVALVELSSQAIKRVLPRPRPQLDGLPPLAPTPSPRSFPSSHTAAAVAAIDAFAGLAPESLLRAIAVASAFSRLYLGVHYPSDVAAGAVLGRVLARGAAPGRDESPRRR